MATRTVIRDEVEEEKEVAETVEEKALAPRRRKRPSNESEEIEQWLKKHGVGYTYEQDLPITVFNQKESLHNQARNEALRPELVARYETAWRNKVNLPPVVAHNLSGQLIMVDGNHRLAAAIAAEKTTISTYIIHKATDENILAMTYTANAYHGQPTSDEERAEQAKRLVQRGAKVAYAARTLGVKEGTVRALVAYVEAENRIVDLGIDVKEWDGLSNKVQLRLHTIVLDNVFREALKLTREANLNLHQVNDLVKAIEEVSSSVERQLEVVATARESYIDQIDSAGGGVFSRERTSRRGNVRGRMLASLGMVKALPEDLTSVVSDMAPHERTSALERVEVALERIENLKKLLVAARD